MSSPEGFDFEAYDQQEDIDRQVRLGMFMLELGELTAILQEKTRQLDGFAREMEAFIDTIVAKNGIPPEHTS